MNDKWHYIVFLKSKTVRMRQPTGKVDQMIIKPKVPLKTQTQPYTAQGREYPIEVCDVHFEDGCIAIGVPYGAFEFLEEDQVVAPPPSDKKHQA